MYIFLNSHWINNTSDMVVLICTKLIRIRLRKSSILPDINHVTLKATLPTREPRSICPNRQFPQTIPFSSCKFDFQLLSKYLEKKTVLLRKERTEQIRHFVAKDQGIKRHSQVWLASHPFNNHSCTNNKVSFVATT